MIWLFIITGWCALVGGAWTWIAIGAFNPLSFQLLGIGVVWGIYVPIDAHRRGWL